MLSRAKDLLAKRQATRRKLLKTLLNEVRQGIQKKIAFKHVCENIIKNFLFKKCVKQ